MAASVPPRSKIDPKHTWNAESVFRSPKAWEEALASVLIDVSELKQFAGRLADGPDTLLRCLKAVEDLQKRAYHLFVYASFASSVDTADQQAAAMNGRAQGMVGQVFAAVSFLKPELLAVGRATLDEWMRARSDLARYRHYVDDLFRKQKHVRSAEVEELLGMLADPFSGPSTTASVMANADFAFPPAVDSEGRKTSVTQGNYYTIILGHRDRAIRRSAFDGYMGRYLEYKNTLASNLTTSIKANVLAARARRHESSLHAALFEHNIPPEVFHSLISTFRRNLPVWHRYFEIRRRALKQRDIGYYDMWAPLGRSPGKKIPFEQAVQIICDALSPMGKDYVETIRRGCLEQRWVDIYPNQGKQAGAFSSGAQGTHPFVMMSYTGELESLSTLAHELGHSMHSYLTWKHQPVVYADYSMFVAEVASNFHQAMVRAHLLGAEASRDLQIGVIEEAMSNFFRYFFQMPTLARFELETHQRVEAGQSLTADSMIDLMADLFTEAFGPGVRIDRRRVGMVWSTFAHLFIDYYVFQYATGISGAHALSGRILRKEPGAVEDYLGFLRAGSSDYPLEVLRRAGVDLATAKPVEETFSIMEGYIDRLEKLLFG